MHSVYNLSTTLRLLNRIQRLKWISGQYPDTRLEREIIKPLCNTISRIICTDSRLQGSIKLNIQTEEGRSEQMAQCLPALFFKDNCQVVDSHCLKVTSVPYEYCNIELLRNKEISDLHACLSFFYDVNLDSNDQSSLPVSSISYYSFEDIYDSFSCSSLSNKEANSSGSKEVFLITGIESQENDSGRPSEEQLLLIIDRLTHCLLNFFEKPHDFSIYHKNIIFQNNIKGVTVKGLSAYSQTMYLLKFYGYVQFAKVKVEILKITHHTEDGTIRVRWRVNGVYRHKVLLHIWKLRSMNWKQFIQEEAEWLDGFSVFSVGPDGLIYKHICDKMTPNDDVVEAKKHGLRSKLLGLFELTPRAPPAGSLHALIPCCRIQELYSIKRPT